MWDHSRRFISLFELPGDRIRSAIVAGMGAWHKQFLRRQEMGLKCLDARGSIGWIAGSGWPSVKARSWLSAWRTNSMNRFRTSIEAS